MTVTPLAMFFLQEAGGADALSCQGASRSFLITCLTIDLVVVLVCIALKWYLGRRLAGYLTSLLVPLVIAFAVSTALVAWNPLKTELLLDCIASQEYSRYVMMAHSSAVARGLVLGGLVTGVLYFIILFVVGLIARARKG